jgi:parallel beta-helix repeat protein
LIVVIFLLSLSFYGIVADESTLQKTIYVDDDNTMGPWDGTQEHPFQKIQDGIDNASDGDTIFVYSGMYYENVVVNKSINLIGEDRGYTCIDGRKRDNVVEIVTDNVNLSGFTIQNSKRDFYAAGVYIRSSYHNITGNYIVSNSRGIYIEYYGNHIISGNTVLDSEEFGIYIGFCDNNTIQNNTVSNNRIGIWSEFCNRNTISENDITNNTEGIMIRVGKYNKINYNNVAHNLVNANFLYFLFGINSNNWNYNYWGRVMKLPKPIFGLKYMGIAFFPLFIPWVIFDFNGCVVEDGKDSVTWSFLPVH